MSDLYERFTFRGVTLDRMTIAALLAAEKQLQYDNRLAQGSYNAGGVGASGGTHDGGGALDAGWRIRFRKQTHAFRFVGHFMSYPRFRIPGVWERHNHCVLIGNDKASPAAKAQIAEYRQGGDALVGSTPDRYKRPSPITEFNYKKAGLVSWRRFNAIAEQKDRKADTDEGVKQVETVARALRGFGMDLPAHKKGRADRALLDALERFAVIRRVRDTEVRGPLNPQLLWELCIPVREDD